jgi:hypothetical protein
MPRTIRVHLDELCPRSLAEGLRRHGIDFITAVDANLRTAPDEAHLEFALAQERVLFTQDQDYLRLHARGVSHAGMAYCHFESRSLGLIIRGLVLIWEIYEPEEMRNRIEWL